MSEQTAADLHVSFEVDEQLRSVQPGLMEGEGVIRNRDGNFVKGIPRECYDTLSLDERERVRLRRSYNR